jgi:hypothetical protein
MAIAAYDAADVSVPSYGPKTKPGAARAARWGSARAERLRRGQRYDRDNRRVDQLDVDEHRLVDANLDHQQLDHENHQHNRHDEHDDHLKYKHDQRRPGAVRRAHPHLRGS